MEQEDKQETKEEKKIKLREKLELLRLHTLEHGANAPTSFRKLRYRFTRGGKTKRA